VLYLVLVLVLELYSSTSLKYLYLYLYLRPEYLLTYAMCTYYKTTLCTYCVNYFDVKVTSK